ncbi:MAG TPA: TonB-dependent receptor [Gammaproteobacteria bacterium]
MLHASFQINLLTFCLVCSGYAMAETQILDPIVVTATRTAQTIDNTLAPVTLITRADIEQSQAQSLPELLAGFPGMDISSQGGLGKNTSLFIRGTNTGHTLFLIDGIRVGSATLGATAIEHIPLQQIDRIEIVRGPRSSLYGSEAIGGIVQIFTRQGSNTTRVNVNAGYGSYATSELAAGVNGPVGSGSYNLQTAFTETDGIDIHDNGHPDEDGYRNRSFTASFNHGIGTLGDIALRLSHTDADNEYDNSFDTTAINNSHTLQNTISGDFSFFIGSKLDNLLRVSQQRDEYNDFENSLANGAFDTLRDQVLLQSDYHISDNHTLTLGFEKLAEEVEASVNFAESERDNRAVFVQTQNNFGQQDVILALRQDNNEAFGHHTTGNIDWRWKFSKNASITAAYGHAFKAPTFNDLYWPAGPFTAGNPNLVPEKSRSAEIITRIKTDDVAVSINIYQTRIKDMIDWQPDSFFVWSPQNVNKAVIQGIETTIETNIANWDIAFTLNLIDPRDEITNTRLQRRTSKSTRLDMDRAFSKLTTGITILAYGERYDDAANTDKLSGYGLVNVRSSYELTKSFSIKAKVDNLLDKEYETIRDYNNLGRVVFVSLNYNID